MANINEYYYLYFMKLKLCNSKDWGILINYFIETV